MEQVTEDNFEKFTIVKDGRSDLRRFLSFGQEKKSRVYNLRVNWDKLPSDHKAKLREHLHELSPKKNPTAEQRTNAIDYITKLSLSKHKDYVKIKPQKAKFKLVFTKLKDFFASPKSHEDIQKHLQDKLDDFGGDYELVKLGKESFYRDGDKIKWLAIDLKEIENRFDSMLVQGTEPAETVEEWKAKVKKRLEEILYGDVNWESLSDKEVARKRDEVVEEAISFLKESFADTKDSDKSVVNTGVIGHLEFEAEQTEISKSEIALTTANFTEAQRTKEGDFKNAVKELNSRGLFAIATVDTQTGSSVNGGLIVVDLSVMGREEERIFFEEVFKIVRKAGSGVVPASLCESILKDYKHALVENMDTEGASPEDLKAIKKAKKLRETVFPLQVKPLSTESFETVSKKDYHLYQPVVGQSIVYGERLARSYIIEKAGKDSIEDSIDELISRGKLPEDFRSQVAKRINGQAKSDLGTLDSYLQSLIKKNDSKSVIQVNHEEDLKFEKLSGIPILKVAVGYEKEKRRLALINSSKGDAGLTIRRVALDNDRLKEFGQEVLLGLIKIRGFKDLEVRDLLDPEKLLKKVPDIPTVFVDVSKFLSKGDFGKDSVKNIKKSIEGALVSAEISSLEAKELMNLIFLLENGYIPEDTRLPRPFRRDFKFKDTENLEVDTEQEVRLYFIEKDKQKIIKAYATNLSLCKSLSAELILRLNGNKAGKIVRNIKKLVERVESEIYVNDSSSIDYLTALSISRDLKELCGDSFKEMLSRLGSETPSDLKRKIEELQNLALELANSVELSSVGLIPARGLNDDYIHMLVNSAQYVKEKVIRELQDKSFEEEEAHKFKSLILKILSDSSTKLETSTGSVDVTGVPVRQLERILRAVELSHEKLDLKTIDYRGLKEIIEKLLPKESRTNFKEKRGGGKSFSEAKEEAIKNIEKLKEELNKKRKSKPLLSRKFIKKLEGRIKRLKSANIKDLQKLLIEAYKLAAKEQGVSEVELRELIKILEKLYAHKKSLSRLESETLTIEVDGKKESYVYPTDSEFKTDYPIAHRRIKEIKSFITAGNHIKAKELIEVNKRDFVRVLNRVFDSETRFIDGDEELLIFKNEIGDIETWRIGGAVKEKEDYQKRMWEIESLLDWGVYDEARRLLSQTVDKKILHEVRPEDDDRETVAERIEYFIPDQKIVKRPDGEARAVAFDENVFGLTDKERIAINSIEDYTKGVDDDLKKKRENYISMSKRIMATQKSGDYKDAMDAVQSLQKIYVTGIEGQKLIQISEPLSREEANRILANQLKSSLSEEGDHPMLKDGVITLPFTDELERVISFSKKKLNKNPEAKAALNQLLWDYERQRLTPLHNKSSADSVWGSVEEIFRNEMGAYKKYSCSEPIERTRDPVTPIRYSSAQALFDVFELNRIDSGLFAAEDPAITKHVKELRSLLFDVDRSKKLSADQFKKDLKLYWGSLRKMKMLGEIKRL